MTCNGQLVTLLTPYLKTLFPGSCHCGSIVKQNSVKGSSRASMNIKKQPELSKSETGLAKKNVADVSFAKI